MSAPRSPVGESLLQKMGVGLRLPPILGIFLTVFLDLLSFGLFIPDLQLRGKELGAAMLGSEQDPRLGLLVGFTLGVFSLAQLLTAPFLGRLSDKHGRRKVLLATTLLSLASYLVYAHAVQWGWILGSRILSGIAAANLGVAFAYIADVTAPKDRAKGLGMVGVAFGLGFILGPVAGALLLSAGGNRPMLLGYVGATLAALNFLYVVFVLPESLPEGRKPTGGFVENLRSALSSPGLGLLLALFVVANFAFTNLETTFFQLLADPRSVFHLGDDKARITGGLIMGTVGIVGAFMQGYVVRKVTPKYGEVRLLRFAYLLMIPALVAVPFCPLWVPLILAITVLGIATGLAQPSISSLISRSAPKNMQGGVFGLTQSLGAMARFVSPLISNSLFHWQPHYPYLFGAALIVVPAAFSWRLRMPSDEGG